MRQTTERHEFSSFGYLTIPMLEFLKGRQWNDYTKGLVYALRPSSVRVSSSDVTSDAAVWRVTVWVKDGLIRAIEQEVEVGLADDVQHGADLWQKVHTE